jgi:hypothetical protein
MRRVSVKLNNWLFWIKARLDERAVTLLAGVVVMLFLGDVVLGWIGTLLHYVIEVLELGLEHLIEAMFHVSQRAAQIVTAWTGLLIFLVLGWFVFRKMRAFVRDWIALKLDGLKLYSNRRSSRHKPSVYAGMLVTILLVIYFQF